MSKNKKLWNILKESVKDSVARPEDIINEIDKISVSEQYESTKVSVIENILDNKINLNYKIEDTEKYIVEKINIFGNFITDEKVIRKEMETIIDGK